MPECLQTTRTTGFCIPSATPPGLTLGAMVVRPLKVIRYEILEKRSSWIVIHMAGRTMECALSSSQSRDSLSSVQEILLTGKFPQRYQELYFLFAVLNAHPRMNVGDDQSFRGNMRVKTVPRQHLVHKYGAVIDGELDSSRISKSEPCLRFNDALDTMHGILSNKQDSGPGIDEALDLAMPTRSRCQHEYYRSCFSLEEDFTHASSDDQLEAINLSLKDRPKSPKTLAPPVDSKNTFLYKMLTDPTFLESLRKDKIPANHACPFCKQNFTSEEDLTNHLNVRKDETNQVACCACGKTFAQKRYLRYHQRCHSERNKFTCDICTKNYSRLDNLTRHNIFHTNPDKFPCPSCERTFARKDLLKKHLKCHENRHRYHCGICDKYFKGPLSLENHKNLFHSNA